MRIRERDENGNLKNELTSTPKELEKIQLKELHKNIDKKSIKQVDIIKRLEIIEEILGL